MTITEILNEYDENVKYIQENIGSEYKRQCAIEEQKNELIEKVRSYAKAQNLRKE